MRNYGVLKRLLTLLRGALSGTMRGLEIRHPEAVYDAAIQRRTQQFDRLREAVGRLAYLRHRLDATVTAQRSDLALVEAALRAAASASDDAAALALIQKKRQLTEAIAALEGKAQALVVQTDRAKCDLGALRQAIDTLKEERSEMLSRRAHARVRVDVAEILQPGADDAVDDEALENVRESIFQLEHTINLEPLPPAAHNGVSLEQLRRETEQRADLAVLAALRE